MKRARRPLRIALVGTGKMARSHSQAYLTAARFLDPPVEPVLAVLCGRRDEPTQRLAAALGWEEASLDWRSAVSRGDVDLVDVCTSTASHAEISCAAAAAGKAVIVEKPLALDVPQAESMVEAAESAGVASAIVFNYRYVPAVRQARELIASGQLGEIRHVALHFLQDWLTDPARPMSWRLRRGDGGGVLSDLGSHLVDLVHHLVGPVVRVAASSAGFITKRRDESGTKQPVDVEDAVQALAVTASGTLATLELSRVAGGHRCSSGFEVVGSQGSVRWEFQRFNDLDVYLSEGTPGLRGWRRVSVTTPGLHPWADRWWGNGHVIGYEETFVHLLGELLNHLAGESAAPPGFRDGLACQRVLAAVESATRSGRWKEV